MNCNRNLHSKWVPIWYGKTIHCQELGEHYMLMGKIKARALFWSVQKQSEVQKSRAAPTHDVIHLSGQLM